jgi:hypothetical protein
MFRASFRDNDSHFFFVGADMQFTSQINGSLRVGAEYLGLLQCEH